jgi:hypothetical protein
MQPVVGQPGFQKGLSTEPGKPKVIILYALSFGKDSPFTFSLAPFPSESTYFMETQGQPTVQAQRKEIRVTVPDGSKLEGEGMNRVLVWNRDGRPIRLTQNAVFAYAQYGDYGFSFAK